jgi:hypothetical protein
VNRIALTLTEQSAEGRKMEAKRTTLTTGKAYARRAAEIENARRSHLASNRQYYVNLARKWNRLIVAAVKAVRS